ncbi:hypothetical protein HMI54_002377 [Coelomomyces lativittatus]|nr:hypothetical protein HMI55_001451 [Coelomomyces lativittatus]KAJ1507150.1 hypothetical protein HMI56_000251 [Coelomomyces lativittatus]KAJ1509460.1 hypothetical protein HMI54_002377 [Coelomomyces lativittatus]
MHPLDFVHLLIFLTICFLPGLEAIPTLSNDINQAPTLKDEIVSPGSEYGIFVVKLLSKENNATSSWTRPQTVYPSNLRLRFEIESESGNGVSTFDAQLENIHSIPFPQSSQNLDYQACNYSGNILNSSFSTIFLDLCNGIQGTISVSPSLQFTIASIDSPNETRIALYRRKSLSFYSPYLYKRQVSNAPKTVYVLIAYFVNPQRNSLDATKKMFEILQSIFASQQQGLGLQLVLRNVIDLSPQLLSASAQNPSALLKAWCEFWRSRFGSSTDVGYLITFDALFNGGITGSGCQTPPGVSCGIIQGSNDPRQVALNLLHGIGHTLGVSHDAEARCGTNGIMRLPLTTSASNFSSCSLEQLKTYFDTHDVQVLVKSQVNSQVNYLLLDSPVSNTPLASASPSTSTNARILISTPPMSVTPIPVPVAPTLIPKPTVNSMALPSSSVPLSLPAVLFSMPPGSPTPIPQVQPTSMLQVQPTAIPQIQRVQNPLVQAAPQVQPVSMPQVQAASMPQVQAASMPLVQPASMSQGQPLSMPQVQAASMPQVQAASMPLVQPASMSQGQPLSMPQVQAASMPQVQAVPIPQVQPIPISQAQPVSNPQVQSIPLPQVQPVPNLLVQATPMPQVQPASLPPFQALPILQGQGAPLLKAQSAPIPQIQGSFIPTDSFGTPPVLDRSLGFVSPPLAPIDATGAIAFAGLNNPFQFSGFPQPGPIFQGPTTFPTPVIPTPAPTKTPARNQGFLSRLLSGLKLF